jgi:HEAT repeat protein
MSAPLAALAGKFRQDANSASEICNRDGLRVDTWRNEVPMTIDEDELAERPLNISQIRRHGWTATEIARATVAMARLAHVRPEGAATDEDVVISRELVYWLDAIGSSSPGYLADDLNGHTHKLCPVPARFQELVDKLSAAENERIAKLRAAYTDPVPLLIDLVADLTPGERAGKDEPHRAHEAAILALGELATDEALRFLVSSLPSWWHSEQLCELGREALERAGARLLETALDAWDGADGSLRCTLAEVLANSKVRDDRLFERLMVWLSVEDQTDREAALGAIADYGDAAAIPILHALLDEHLETFPKEGSYRLADSIAAALRTLGGTLGSAQIDRVIAIIERCLDASPPPKGTRWMLVAATSILDVFGIELSTPTLMRLEQLPPSYPLIRIAGNEYGHPSAEEIALHSGYPSPYQLIEWAQSADAEVRRKAVQGGSLPQRAKELLVHDPDVEVRRDLARRYGTELAHIMLDDEDEYVRCFAVYGAPAERLPGLMEDPSPVVREKIAHHRQGAPFLQQLAEDPSADVRAQVAGSDAASLELLQRLASDEEPRVRLYVAHSRKTPLELVHRLSLDSDERVRETALRALGECRRLCDCCGRLHPLAASR